MGDFLTPFIIITLLVVIVIQAVERYFFAEQQQREQSKLLAAFLSKNLGEYTTAIKVEKEPPAQFRESDDVELAQASDETFDKFIANQTR